MGLFSPSYDGTIEIMPLPSDFTDRIARRIENGLLNPGSRRRANYVVRSKSGDAISFSAVGFWTAYNVGLNEVELRRAGPNSIAYHGSYRRWATYVVIQALVVVAAIIFVILVVPSGRDDVARYSWGWWYLGALLVFFGLVFPWLMVAMHRRFAARALEGIVRQAVAV